jgi:putative ABC transport system substrate-binding protein
MKRREFVALLGGAVVAAPLAASLAAQAQQHQNNRPRIGIIDDSPMWNPFRDALQEAGYVDRRTATFEYRRADGNPERLVAAARELAAIPVDVIATFGSTASFAAKTATSRVPIVVISVGDPVRTGLVQSLARPGGNITGNTILAPEIGPKRLQLIKEALPSVSRVALLWNPDNASNAALVTQMHADAPRLGLVPMSVQARNTGELQMAFTTLTQDRPDAVLFTNDPLHQANIQKIVTFMFQQGIPGMYQTRDNVAAGGLMSYGASFPDLFRSGASYVQKVLRGAKPADLPIQPPDRFELVINLKTAKAIGLKISEAVLLRADEVIE